jgi:HEAT repeat protein
MDQSLAFARHFARLIGLLLHESGNIVEQKAALRGLVAASKAGALSFTMREWQVFANGASVPETFGGVQDLAAQMYGHSVIEVCIGVNASPGDMLELARALVREPMPGGRGRSLAKRITELSSKAVRVSVEADTDPIAIAAESRAPIPDAFARPAPRMSGSYLAFAAAQAPTRSLPDLLAELEETDSEMTIAQLLEDIATLIEAEWRSGHLDTVADAMASVVRSEHSRSHAGQKRAYSNSLRRLNKKTLVRTVAEALPVRREAAADYVAVLSRMGRTGTEILVEHLVAADTLPERRAYFDALLTLRTGAPELIHMLGDTRWYVLRNVADLLGEMRSVDADAALAALITHEDERVRRSVAGALSKLGTPKAYAALRSALRDGSAQIRLLAAAGLASRKQNTAAHTLTSALAVEEDGEVQMQLVSTLGRVSTPDAVQQLIALAESAGGLFRRKSAALRVAAVEALGEARSPIALAALNRLRTDKDAHVREAAIRAVNGVRRDATSRG